MYEFELTVLIEILWFDVFHTDGLFFLISQNEKRESKESVPQRVLGLRRPQGVFPHGDPGHSRLGKCQDPVLAPARPCRVHLAGRVAHPSLSTGQQDAGTATVTLGKDRAREARSVVQSEM